MKIMNPTIGKTSDGKTLRVNVAGDGIAVGRCYSLALQIAVAHSHGALEVDADVAFIITLPVKIADHSIRCIECGLEFGPEQLESQIKGYLEEHFFRRELTHAVRVELVEAISPWWDRFAAGESLCFGCGVSIGDRSVTTSHPGLHPG